MSWCIDREEFDEAVKNQEWNWIWSVIDYSQNCGMNVSCPRCMWKPAAKPPGMIEKHRVSFFVVAWCILTALTVVLVYRSFMML